MLFMRFADVPAPLSLHSMFKAQNVRLLLLLCSTLTVKHIFQLFRGTPLLNNSTESIELVDSPSIQQTANIANNVCNYFH